MPVQEKHQLNLVMRVRLALGFVVLAFGIITVRLWYLQILRGEYFRFRSENNRLRTVYIPPPRGTIYDRHGRELVKNRPSFNVDFVREDSPDPDATLHTLARIASVPADELLAKARAPQSKRRKYEPKLLLRDVSRDLLARIEARRYALPGVIIDVVPVREYPHGQFATHALGYLREITDAQLEMPPYPDPRPGELVGQFGVEKAEEYLLHGRRGVQGVIVNAMGLRTGAAFVEPERAGHNLTVTLDYDTQRAAEEATLGKRSAVVAMDPHTGEILAMVSQPGFDPNVFSGGVSAKDWNALVHGPDRRLTNRAVQGLYHPGSVFKIIMATAGLAEGAVNTTERVNCAGSYRVGRSRAFQCHKHSGHGAVNIKDALRESCNVFFYTVGQRLGIDRIHEYATRFGFGSATGLGIVAEPDGLVPSPEWKKSQFKDAENQKWYAGETPSVSIGQGALVVTPLQVARALSALVNGGKVLRPKLVRNVEAPDGPYRRDSSGAEVLSELGVSESVLKSVQEGLFAVVNETGGTGKRAQLREDLGISVGGKTGTAQVRSVDMVQGKFEDELAWFAGYAPADNPKIVVVAIVEGGGHGGVAAAPVVKQVMEGFFDALNRHTT